MSLLTYKEFKDIVAPYAGRTGKCDYSKEVDDFAYSVMQNLLYSGSTSANRLICIQAYKGCISLPPEVEVPLKARIDREVVEIWSKWYTMHSGGPDLDKSCEVDDILAEEGSSSPLAYPVPDGGRILAVIANCEESEDAYIDIQGEDVTGKTIYTFVGKEQITGERFYLKKDNAMYGVVPFGKVTGVVKPKTNGYITLFTVDSVNNNPTLGQFLADWAPTETKPLYRQFKVIKRSCGPLAQLSMLCRARLKDSYHDNELTLFDNRLAVLLSAQRINSETNEDIETAAYKKSAVEDILEKEAGYKRTTCNKVDVFRGTSAGTVRNILSPRRLIPRRVGR